MKNKQINNKFKDYSASKIPDIDSFIRNYYAEKINSSPQPLLSDIYSDISEYVLRDGKRLRPLLLLIAFEAYSGKKASKASTVKLAAVLEIMHSLLLVQDDIIDRSTIRRGGTSMHITAAVKYSSRTNSPSPGEDTAAIIADIMFANAVEIISSVNLPSITKDSFLTMFSRTYEMTALGQILDITNGDPVSLSTDDQAALEISSYKTAYYTIFYPIAMGLTLSGSATAKEERLIREFSLPLGLAFQIRDDLLGVFGQSSDTGKPSDSDISEGKLTLLIQNTVDLLSSEKRKTFIKLFTSKRKRKGSPEKIRKLIESSGAVEKTIDSQKKYIQESKDALKKLSIGKKHRELFEDLIETIYNKQ